VAAQAGYNVFLQDISPEAIARSLAQIKWSTRSLPPRVGLRKAHGRAGQDQRRERSLRCPQLPVGHRSCF
jgi:3-hydroxyacyl-CoA dehydrogenase